MNVDIEKLEALAKAATQGQWRKGKNSDDVVADHPAGHEQDPHVIDYYGGHLVAESISSHNREFIAAANPAAVLQLIAELKQAEEDNVTWKGGISALGEALKKLTLCARTTGGTAGPDQDLMDACESAENALSFGGVSRAIDYIEGLKAENKELKEKYEASRDRKNSITALKAENESLRKDITATAKLYELEGYDSLPAALRNLAFWKSENDSLRKDAERYRWLRDEASPADVEFFSHQSSHGFEAEVDAAMIKGAACTHSAN